MIFTININFIYILIHFLDIVFEVELPSILPQCYSKKGKFDTLLQIFQLFFIKILIRMIIPKDLSIAAKGGRKLSL